MGICEKERNMRTLYKSIFIIFSLYQLCYYTSGLQCHRQGVCTESKLIAYYNLDSYIDVIDVSKGKARCDVKCRTSLTFDLNCTHNVWDHRAKICLLYEGCAQVNTQTCPLCIVSDINCPMEKSLLCNQIGHCTGTTTTILNTYARDAGACMEHCRITEGCQFYTWQAGGNCFLNE